MAWNATMTIFCFLVWFYPVRLYRNMEPTDSVSICSFHTLLLVLVTFLFASGLAHVLIARSSSEEVAGAFATLLLIMLYAFCGIFAGPDTLPRFWIFMYRVNPFTYLVSSFMSTTLGQAPAYCAETEFQHFTPANNGTCLEYMQGYISMVGGYLRNEEATEQCSYCQLNSTDQFLQRINSNWDTRWWDFGLL
ncbi:Multidrug resistance protein [Didymella sp. IMI 355093]|nr:Multidrug resistance protein [Didymella sp. IMI 355093]